MSSCIFYLSFSASLSLPLSFPLSLSLRALSFSRLSVSSSLSLSLSLSFSLFLSLSLALLPPLLHTFSEKGVRTGNKNYPTPRLECDVFTWSSSMGSSCCSNCRMFPNPCLSNVLHSPATSVKYRDCMSCFAPTSRIESIRSCSRCVPIRSDDVSRPSWLLNLWRCLHWMCPLC